MVYTLATMTNCPYCGKLTDPKLDGCPHCGGYLKKKVAAATPVALKNSQSCPACRAVVQQGDIICVVCGTNLLTGQKIADAPDPESSSSGIPIAGIVIGVTATIAIVLGGIWMYTSSSNPVERARALIEDFNYPEAHALLQDYITKDPDNEEAMFELAKLQWRAKEFGEAAISFENVIEINPANIDAGLLAVLCLQLTGNAQSNYHEISILEKISENADRDARVWLMLAMAKGARGEGDDYTEQATALEQVLELSPDSKLDHLDLGIGQALLGNYQRAKSELNQVSSTEENGTALAFLGYVAVLEQKIERQESNQRQQAVESEVQRLQGMYGEFDSRELLNHALKNKISNLEAAFTHWQFTDVKSTADKLQKEQDITTQKREAAVVTAGGSTQAGTQPKPEGKAGSIREAFALAKKQLST